MNIKAYPRAYLQYKIQSFLRNSDLNSLFSENFSLLCNCKFPLKFCPEHPSGLKDKNQFDDAITKMNSFVYLSQCILCKDNIYSQLSKRPSNLKINGTQENVTFSGQVFHGLSCGIFLFVASVSFKNHPLNG